VGYVDEDAVEVRCRERYRLINHTAASTMLAFIATRVLRRCRCSHPRSAHEHYRAGTDRSLCDCTRYRR
jgi:hypothetical protein